ncbi:MAG: radical SAM protein [Acidobacteria bacterium]|nr:radical SAM protein [Acidobacteriota bacterium]
MKIVLVNVIEFEPIHEFLHGKKHNQSTQYPPIGLLTLAAVLEAKGYEVEVVDFGNLILNAALKCDDHLPTHAAQYLQSRQGDVVGFSSRCDNYLHTLRIAEEFHLLEPLVPIVFGGPQATITDVATIEQFGFVNCVVRHEAEYSFPALLEALDDGRPFNDIPGVVFRQHGKVVKTPDPSLILDLDQIPMPSFKYFPIDTLNTMPVEVGRGCPFGCTFCVTNRYFNRRYRLKSADRIIDEVIWLQENYGFQRYTFIHDMLTASRQLVMQLCRRMKEREVKIEWSCSARTDCVDRELLETMRAVGCRDVYFGIETGSHRMQKVVNKNLKLEGVFPVIDLCAELGIAATTSFITGFPEEQEEDVEATLRMMLQLSPKVPNVQLHLYSPTPGTPLNDKFSDRLVFTGYISDFGFSTTFGDDEQQMITQHPDIFTNYFQVEPLHLDFASLRGLDAFGYTLQAFKHFFFYLMHEAQAPSLFEVWQRVRRWADEQQVAWSIATMLANGLTDEMAAFIQQMLNQEPQLSPVLTEAFNFDRALLRLGTATNLLADDYKSDLQALRRSMLSLKTDKQAVLRLRTPVVLSQTRCPLAKMMEAVNTRKLIPLTINEKPLDIGIYAVKDRSGSHGFTFAVLEVNEIYQAILAHCDKAISQDDLLIEVRASLRQQGIEPPHCELLCERALERLVRLQLLSVRMQGETSTTDALTDLSTDSQRPALIRMQPLAMPLPALPPVAFRDQHAEANRLAAR